MKTKVLRLLEYILTFILILTAVASVWLGISLKRTLDYYDHITKTLDYNIITLRPRYWDEYNADDEIDSFITTDGEFKEILSDDNLRTRFYNAIWAVEGFYPIFAVGYNKQTVLIKSTQLPYYPTPEQMHRGQGYGKRVVLDERGANAYAEWLSAFNEGKDFYVTFCCRQIDYRVKDTYYLPLFEGKLNDITIKYSDYVNTGKAIPVVIGYDLRDLFSVGDVFDALATFVMPYEQRNSVDSQEEHESNIKLEVVGILAEDAYALSPDSAKPTTRGLNTAIVMPYFDIMGSVYDNSADIEAEMAWRRTNVNPTILTKMSPDEADEKFMQLVSELGMEDLYGGTNYNITYMVKGVALDTYKSIVYSIAGAALVLLLVALTGGIVNSVNKNVRKYSIHFLVGADKRLFVRKTVVPIMCTGLFACVTTDILLWLCRGIIASTFGTFSLSPAETILISLAIFVGVAAFVFLVALIKINKTDFSRTLKEDV